MSIRIILTFILAAVLTGCSTNTNPEAPAESAPELSGVDIAPSPEPVVEPAPEPEEFVEPPCLNTAIDSDFYGRVLDALVDHGNKSRFLSWENDYGNAEGAPDNVRVVYRYRGNRYTVWHNPPSERGYGTMEGWLAVWVRPDGSTGPEAIDTWSDNMFTGCVNFGIGDESRLGPDRKALTWGEQHRGEERGIEHHVFWQEHHAKAIDGLATALNVR